MSRFNFDKALKEAYDSGKLLVKLSEERKPFKDLTDRIAYHHSLKFMNYAMVDEILLLAEQLMETSKEKEVDIKNTKTQYEKARKLIEQRRKAESIKNAVKAYETLCY